MSWQRVEVKRSDPATVPWQDGCDVCVGLSSDPEPGLFSWIVAVGSHMDAAHEIDLVPDGRRTP